MNYALSQDENFAGARLVSISIVAAVLLACGAILAAFAADVKAAIAIWDSSSAYSYCYLILPISLYLIYARRVELSRIEPVPSLSGAAVLFVSVVVWWAGMAASIIEIRQFAVVGMLQAVVLCLLGWRFYRSILFPMLYLFLMVPTATALLGPLQTLTTVMSSQLLRLSGIPTFSENHLIEVPHGLYEVAMGCAGLNFLLTTLALSLLYVLLVFRGGAKRYIGVAVALLLSLLTNAVRVFGIIWLAEATERRIDIVDDHLLYGWGVYFVFMLLAMAIGLQFRDPPEPEPSATRDRTDFYPRMSKPWLAAVAITFLAGGIPVAFAAIEGTPVGDAAIRLELPIRAGEWIKTEADAAVALPAPRQADGLARFAYADTSDRVDVLIAYYWRQREGHKITDIAGEIRGAGKWSIVSQDREIVGSVGSLMPVEALQLTQGKRRVLVWTYIWVGGRRTSNVLFARLLGMGSAIGADSRSAVIALAASDDSGQAHDVLEAFFKNTQALDHALAGASLQAN